MEEQNNEKPPSTVYRRDLQAPLIKPTPPSSPVSFSAKKFGLIALIAVVIIIYFSQGLFSTRRIVNILEKGQQTGASIRIYGVEGLPGMYEVNALAKIYGLTPQLTFMQNPSEILNIIPSLRKTETFSMPQIVLPYGIALDLSTFEKIITHLKPKNLNINATDTVILYGLHECGYTDKARSMLDQKHIKYEFVDLNSDAPRYMGEIAAKFIANGKIEQLKKGYAVPLVEIQGHIWARPEVYDVISKMNPGK